MILALVCFFTCLINCAEAQSFFSIKGKTASPQTSKVFLYVVDPVKSDTVLADSATVTLQLFRFKATFQEPKQVVLKLDTNQEKVAFLWDGKIKVQLNDRNISRSLVTNSVATDDWYDFQAEIDPTYEQSVLEFARMNDKKVRPQPGESVDMNAVMSRVRTSLMLYKIRLTQINAFKGTHPKSWVNLYLLAWYRQQLGRSGVYRLMVQLPRNLKESKLYQQLDLALQEMN